GRRVAATATRHVYERVVVVDIALDLEGVALLLVLHIVRLDLAGPLRHDHVSLQVRRTGGGDDRRLVRGDLDGGIVIVGRAVRRREWAARDSRRRGRRTLGALRAAGRRCGRRARRLLREDGGRCADERKRH